MDLKTIKFTDGDFTMQVKVSEDNEAWLTIKELCKLYGREKSVIAKHIKQFLSSNSATELQCVAKIATPRSDGKTYYLPYYRTEIIEELGLHFHDDRGTKLKQFVKGHIDVEVVDSIGNTIIYNNGNNHIPVIFSPIDDTVWMNQNQIATLFGTTRQNITMHIRNIFSDGEIDKNSVSKDFLHTDSSKNRSLISTDGKTYNVVFYNLDMILAIGYRVKSKTAIAFRRWVSSVMKQYITKGYVLSADNIIVTKDSFVQIENDISYLKQEVSNIKEQAFIGPFKDKIISQGEFFDAYVFLKDLVKQAKEHLIIIDPYFDIRGLNIMSHVCPDVEIEVITRYPCKITKNDLKEFAKVRPDPIILEDNSFHDRFIIIDMKSLKKHLLDLQKKRHL